MTNPSIEQPYKPGIIGLGLIPMFAQAILGFVLLKPGISMYNPSNDIHACSILGLKPGT